MYAAAFEVGGVNHRKQLLSSAAHNIGSEENSFWCTAFTADHKLLFLHSRTKVHLLVAKARNAHDVVVVAYVLFEHNEFHLGRKQVAVD